VPTSPTRFTEDHHSVLKALYCHHSNKVTNDWHHAIDWLYTEAMLKLHTLFKMLVTVGFCELQEVSP
jgi:hypothetical protein